MVDQEDNSTETELLLIHHAQLEASGIPKNKWPALIHKLHHNVFDAGLSFGYEVPEDDDGDNDIRVIVRLEEGVKPDDPESIWLIDHAYTFTSNADIRSTLKSNMKLLARLQSILGINQGNEGTPATQQNADEEASRRREEVEQVLREIWSLANMYQISNVPEYPNCPIWYIMDEFGCKIRHCSTANEDEEKEVGREGDRGRAANEGKEKGPTLAMVPFFFAGDQAMYSVIYCIKDMECGDEATRDYLPRETDPYMRAGKLIAFFPHKELPPPDRFEAPVTPSLRGDYALLPNIEHQKEEWTSPVEIRPIRVYTDLQVIFECLTDSRFVAVEDEEGCDVWWASAHVRDFNQFVAQHPTALCCQLPNQKNLVCKDLLIETCSKKIRVKDSGTSSSLAHILPLSFNLETSLHDFINEYRRRANEEDNVWILKPWNAGRSEGIVVSDSLPYLLRLMETGPKVVCKYIEKPVTVKGCKTDLRFYLMIRQGAPHPQAYMHKRFVGRLANHPYSQGDWWDFEKHMTVFHYRSDLTTTNLLDGDAYIDAFDQDNGGPGSFEKVRNSIHAMAADLVRAACTPSCDEKAGSVLGHLAHGRGLFGIDVMLEREEGTTPHTRLIPRLLEVTYCPDLRRVLRNHPTFINEVFQALILDEAPSQEVEKIL